MRKLIVLEHISIDGVIQSPGGRQEDSKDGFEHGGQVMPVVFGGNGNEVTPKHAGHDRVNRKTILRDHHLPARGHQSVADKLDDFVGAVA